MSQKTAGKKAIKIYFDGACLPRNPGGVATYGYVIYDSDGKVVASEKGVVSENGTNNQAEYAALIFALKKAIEMGFTQVEIYGDSQLTVYQINGIYEVKSPNIIPLYGKVKSLLKNFDCWEIKWIRREENKQADALSTEAFIEFVETKNRQKAKFLAGCKVIPDKDGYRIKNYVVTLKPPYCSCPYFKKLNSSGLLKKDGITVRCKHILYVEEYLKNQSNQINSL